MLFREETGIFQGEINQEMKKIIGLLVAAIFLAIQLQAQLFTLGVTDSLTIRNVASDDLGFVFTVGQNSLGQGVVRKYTGAGSPSWTFLDGAGGTYGTNFKILEIAPTGDVYVGGSFGNGAVFAGNTITTSGGTDPMVAKLDAQGNLQWYVSYPGNGTSFEDVYDIRVTANGDVSILGYSNNSIVLNGNTVSTTGARPFFATFTSNGTFVNGGFANTATGACWNASFDNVGNIYATHFDSPNQTLSKFDSTGVLQWQISGTGNGEWWDLAVDSQGDVVAGGSFDGSFSMNGSTYTSTTMWDDLFIFKASSSGNFLWAKQFSSVEADNIYDIELNASDEIFICGIMGAPCNFDLITAPSQGGLETFLAKLAPSGSVEWATSGGNPSVDIQTGLHLNLVTGKLLLSATSAISTCTFGPLSMSVTNSYWVETIDHACTARGILFRDLDGNGLQGVGENGFARQVVQMTPGPLYGFSSPTGNYEIYSNIGNYSIGLPNMPLYHTYSGATIHAANYTALGQFDLLNDFALEPIPNMNDLRVHATALNYGARQGRTEGYVIQYENVGTTTLNGLVSFKYPAGSSFSYANPAPSGFFTASDSVEWNAGSLAPGQTGYIFVAIQMPTFYALNSQIPFHAHITPVIGDQAPGDNHRHFTHTVVGPYDPNIKQVYPEGDISPQFVAASEHLTYTVYFQNTGNDTAYFVRLEDTLSANLDLSTFEWLSSSHPNTWQINNDRRLRIDYDNIMLPDSFVDELGSHGFFQYRAKPLSSLQVGDEIHNRANITFDYNVPIVTNTTVTRVAVPVAVVPQTLEEALLKVFPNPTQGNLNFSLVGNLWGTSVSVAIHDIHGRKVRTVPPFSAGTQVDVSALPAGMYLCRAADARGKVIATVPFVKQ
jgi:uncharacterized repeat protein (TIGR01451 family)